MCGVVSRHVLLNEGMVDGDDHMTCDGMENGGVHNDHLVQHCDEDGHVKDTESHEQAVAERSLHDA